MRPALWIFHIILLVVSLGIYGYSAVFLGAGMQLTRDNRARPKPDEQLHKEARSYSNWGMGLSTLGLAALIAALSVSENFLHVQWTVLVEMPAFILVTFVTRLRFVLSPTARQRSVAFLHRERAS